MKKQDGILNRKRKRKKNKIIAVIIAIVCIGLILGGVIILENDSSKPPETAKVGKEEKTKQPEKPKEPEVPEQPEVTEQIKEQEVVQQVAETEKTDISYFDDAVFIGDSRVEGFVQSSGLSNTTAYTHKGLTVNKVYSDASVNVNGKMVTVMDALRNTKFSKVYIMLGINEMGWVYSSKFIDKYEKIISDIKKINPNAIIYIQSILPVSQKVSDTHEYINNKKIVEFNQLLSEMAAKNKVNYLNVFEAMADENNCLPEEAAFDGIHLKKSYCMKWQDYLLSHVAQ